MDRDSSATRDRGLVGAQDLPLLQLEYRCAEPQNPRLTAKYIRAVHRAGQLPRLVGKICPSCSVA